MLLIALVFAAPVIGAFFWKPTGYVNHGELVKPARPISDIDFIKPDGASFPFAGLKHKWTLLYIGADQCRETCRQNLYKIQQVRLAQAKEAHRVQSVYIRPTGDLPADTNSVFLRYPGMIILGADTATMYSLAKEFVLEDLMPPGAERVYVIDPLGNLMMSYPPDADPTEMRKDLKRLLKVSQIG